MEPCSLLKSKATTRNSRQITGFKFKPRGKTPGMFVDLPGRFQVMPPRDEGDCLNWIVVNLLHYEKKERIVGKSSYTSA